MVEAMLSANIPLALTGIFMLVAILIDTACSAPYHLLGIQLEYPNAKLAEKIAHLCIVLAAITSSFIMGSFCRSFENYFIAMSCWLLTNLIIYAGAKFLASFIVMIFRWKDFVNSKT